jgi:hypothetical protein
VDWLASACAYVVSGNMRLSVEKRARSASARTTASRPSERVASLDRDAYRRASAPPVTGSPRPLRTGNPLAPRIRGQVEGASLASGLPFRDRADRLNQFGIADACDAR